MKFSHCRRHSVFRAFVLDVGKPSSSQWLNHTDRWFVHVSPAPAANAPASRLLPSLRKRRYLESFSFHPKQKQGKPLNSCSFSRRGKSFSASSCMVWNDTGHSPLLHRVPQSGLPPLSPLMAEHECTLMQRQKKPLAGKGRGKKKHLDHCC